jgi:hypothetical protein
VGRRSRQRARADTGAAPDKLTAPSTPYFDDEGNELELRGSLSAASRRDYAQTLKSGLDREDAWQRATELLFERLAVAWTISGVRTEKPKELLARYRAATAAERRFVRDALRRHAEENFPDLEAP